MGCCACCCEAGENPGTCCGDTCCRSPDTCCQGTCQPTCQSCCCTDGVATEVSDPTDCQGTLLDKPAAQQNPDITVEWCGLTLTAKCEPPYSFSVSGQSAGVKCAKTLDIGFGDQEFHYRDPYLYIILSFSNCFGACNLYNLQMDVQTSNQGFVFRTADDLYLGPEVTLKSYKASQSSCDEGLTMTLDAGNSTATNWCGGSGHVVCDEDPVVTVTMAP